MGWSIGFDERWQRDVGYGVPAICDQPTCFAPIDRGLAHVCGEQPFGGEHGCGLYFCADHLEYSHLSETDTTRLSRCERCIAGREPFRPKADVPRWIAFKLADASWQQWRDENAVEVAQLRAFLAAKGKGMDFGRALAALRSGNRVKRSGWNGEPLDLVLKTSAEVELSCIYMRMASGDQFPWISPQADLLAFDWSIVAPEGVEDTLLVCSADSRNAVTITMVIAGRRFDVIAQTTANLLACALEATSLEQYDWPVIEVRFEDGTSATPSTRISDVLGRGVIFVNAPPSRDAVQVKA